MLIDIKFKNYRSIKEEQIFSLEASSLKLKSVNTFTPLKNNKNLNLLKSAVIYGANASGKSNLIRLIWTLRNFVLNSLELKAGDPIPNRFFDPFLLDITSQNEATEISINFIPKSKKRHRYTVKYNRSEILYEYLGVYETNWISKIFERKDANEFVEFGDAMKNKKEDKRVTKNTLFLSKFGGIPNDQLRNIYLYFKEIEVWNIPSVHHINELYNSIQKNLNNPEKQELRKKLSKLISIADTKITEIQVSERPDKDFESLPENIRERVMKDLKFETFGVHKVFNSGSESGIQMLSFNDPGITRY
jgi:AAA15 family ATPase/GTPase